MTDKINEKERTTELVVPESINSKALISGIDVLRDTELIKPEDFEFLYEHIDQYEKRFRTRGLFRSKTEMIAGVLNDSEHPTVDSKYWQAIGEQNVHLSELINLSYETKKIEADNDLLVAEIEELEDEISKCDNPIEVKKLKAKLKKKRVELAQAGFVLTQQRKVAQERLREIKTWEGIIEQLEPNLEFGSEDFELHHGKRYLLRYQERMNNLELMDSSARESVVTNFKAFAKYEHTKGQVLPFGFVNNSGPARAVEGSNIVKLPDGSEQVSNQVNYPSKEDMEKDDPIAAAYFNRKVRKILVAAPHRYKGDRNATNFFAMQTPTAFNCDLDEPYGMTVPDSRNYIVKRAIEQEYDFIFFVDDDVIIPRNALVQLVHLKADIAGGFYYKKYLPLESVGMHINDKNQPVPIEDYTIGDIIHNTLVLPSGCTLIKVDVLKRLEYPWYKTITINDRPTITEDTYLCSKLRDMGVDIITDTGLQCIHVDYIKGLFYGHPEIVDYEKNEIRAKYRDYFAI